MSNVFVERHGTEKYVAIQNKQVIATAKTQAKAIEKAHDARPNDPVLAERVRRTSVGKPDKWRKT